MGLIELSDVSPCYDVGGGTVPAREGIDLTIVSILIGRSTARAED